MKVEIKFITPIDEDGYPCSAKSKFVARHNQIMLWNEYSMLTNGPSKYASFNWELDRPDQDSVTGEFICSFTEYDYEYANELWSYSSSYRYGFKGILIGHTIYILPENFALTSQEHHSECVRDHNEEEFMRFEEEYLKAA